MTALKRFSPHTRFVLGLLCLYLGLSFGYGGRREWRRALERTEPTDKAQLERLSGSDPKTLRLRVPMDGVVRTDTFRESGKEMQGRYWALPLGQSMLLVRTEPYAKIAGEVEGALYPLDAKDRKAVGSEILWPKVYQAAGLPLQKWGHIVPYVFVVPYSPLGDFLALGGSLLLAIAGLVLIAISARALLSAKPVSASPTPQPR